MRKSKEIKSLKKKLGLMQTKHPEYLKYLKAYSIKVRERREKRDERRK